MPYSSQYVTVWLSICRRNYLNSTDEEKLKTQYYNQLKGFITSLIAIYYQVSQGLSK